MRSFSLVTPRGGEREMQIRWMVDDGSEVKEGERLVEFDAARLIQTIEERRLKLRQAENDRESRGAPRPPRPSASAWPSTRRRSRPRRRASTRWCPPSCARVDWRKFQATWLEKKAALDKAPARARRVRDHVSTPTSRARGPPRRKRCATWRRRRMALLGHVARGAEGRHLPGRQLLAVGPRGPAQAPAGRHRLERLSRRHDPRPLRDGDPGAARRGRLRAGRPPA